MAGPTTTMMQVQREIEMREIKKIMSSSEGGLIADVKPMLCRVGDLVQKPSPVKSENVVTDGMLRSAMPKFGAAPLPYDDVLDISMYSAKEIGNESDHLAEFAGIEHHHASYMKTNSRRNLAASWIGRM